MINQELRESIQDAEGRLGEDMQSAIPYQQSRIARWLGAKRVSMRAIVPLSETEGTFTRAWLERPAAYSELGSPISLQTDVVYDPAVTGSAQSYGVNPTTAARLDRVYGLEVSSTIGASPEEQLERLQELDGLVQAIILAEKQRDLSRVPSLHDIKVSGVNA